VLAFACSCTAAQARTAHTSGAVALAGGLFGILGCVGVAELAPSVKPEALGVGLVFVPISVAGALVYAATDSLVSGGPTEHALTAGDRAFATAMELAREAKHAARRGDCAEVLAIQPRVREIDERVYRRFLRDQVIRTCLAPEAGDGNRE
jgi:hypothetical protein